jgi:hypothetical protein
MPVPRLVRFRQSAARNLAADAHVIEFFALCSKAGFYVPQAFAIRQLGESHGTELIQTGEMLDAEIASVPFYTALKGFQRNEFHELSKHRRY